MIPISKLYFSLPDFGFRVEANALISRPWVNPPLWNFDYHDDARKQTSKPNHKSGRRFHQLEIAFPRRVA